MEVKIRALFLQRQIFLLSWIFMLNTDYVYSILSSLSCPWGCQNVRPVKIWWQFVYTVHKGLFTHSSSFRSLVQQLSKQGTIFGDTIGYFPHHQCKWPIIGRKICGANAFLTPSSVSCRRLGKGEGGIDTPPFAQINEFVKICLGKRRSQMKWWI